MLAWRKTRFEHLVEYQKKYLIEKKPWRRSHIAMYKANWAKRTGAGRKSYLKNPSAYKANATARKKHVKLATPKWVDRGLKKQVAEFYKIAEELQWLSNEPLHVDHIVPLRGAEVCGLHVPWNLQVLPASENLTKSNKHETPQ
jgi:hypothetical protein